MIAPLHPVLAVFPEAPLDQAYASLACALLGSLTAAAGRAELARPLLRPGPSQVGLP